MMPVFLNLFHVSSRNVFEVYELGSACFVFRLL
jgi:hypothetical protein